MQTPSQYKIRNKTNSIWCYTKMINARKFSIKNSTVLWCKFVCETCTLENTTVSTEYALMHYNRKLANKSFLKHMLSKGFQYYFFVICYFSPIWEKI